MALTSTVYNLDVSFADADRGVYEDLALRVALHPSETLEFMLARVLAYCLEYEEGITFSKGGISDGDQPPLWVATPDGRIKTWIEIGTPDAERLNKAAKACSIASRTAPGATAARCRSPTAPFPCGVRRWS